MVLALGFLAVGMPATPAAAVQATGGTVDGSYDTNSFVDIAGSLTVIAGSGDTSTNYVDVGGATNAPSRYYRVRLVP